MNNNKDILTELYAEMEALKLRIAFAEMEKEDLKRLSVEPCDYSVSAQKQTMAVIDQELRKRNISRFLRKTLPRAAQIAAAVLLVCFLGLSTAVATVQSVRIKILEFIMNIEEEYTELGFDDSADAYMDVPSDWNGSYYPAYIPEEFVLSAVDPILCEVSYTTPSNLLMQYSEYDENTYVNIDTEDAQNEYIVLHGTSALVSEKEDHVYIAWAIDNRYFLVSVDGSRETAERIAQSVRMIQ